MTSVEDIVSIVEEAQMEEISDRDLPTVAPHSDGAVVLPVGIVDPSGLLDTAVVRELNGYDEEAFAKARTVGAGVLTLLERATESIGGQKPTKKMLEQITVGDRLELMIAIHEATWGDEIDVVTYCGTCSKDREVTVLGSKIKRNVLEDKYRGRTFDFELSSGRQVTLGWPSGVVQDKLLDSDSLTLPEVTTILVTDCVKKLDGMPLLHGEDSARALSVRDRQEIARRVQRDVPGPQLVDVQAECSYCGETLEFNLQVGALFPF